MPATARHFQFRRKTAAQWTSGASVLYAFELGFESDSGLFKVGDGTTAWASLSYGMPIAAKAVATLPTSGIIAGMFYRLTAADSTAKAGPGIYVHDGTGWGCVRCYEPYDFGDLGAAPTLTFIVGCDYLGTQNVNITTAPAITMARVGGIWMHKAGAGTVVGKATMVGRTALESGTDGWTNSGAAKCLWNFLNDGTNIWSGALLGV